VDQTYVDIHGAYTQESKNCFDENDEKIVSLLDERRKALDARYCPNIKINRKQSYAQIQSKPKNNYEK